MKSCLYVIHIGLDTYVAHDAYSHHDSRSAVSVPMSTNIQLLLEQIKTMQIICVFIGYTILTRATQGNGADLDNSGR